MADNNTTGNVASGAAAGATVGGPWGAVIGGGLGLAGSLIGADSARREEERARRAQQRALQMLAGVEIPELQDLMYNYGADALPELVGTLTPEQEQFFEAGPSAMEDVSTDPRLQEAQMAALSQLQDVADGGLTEADMMAAEQIRRSTAAQDQAKQGQILQEMAQRGQAGSGAELIARLKSSQGAADRSSAAGMDLLQQAQARALDAMSRQGTLAGNIRTQDFGEQSDVARAKDVINTFNTRNRQAVESSNVGSRNQAQKYNLGERQRVADNKAFIRRQQEQQRVNAVQDDYNNRYGQAQDRANIHTGQAAQSQRDAKRKAQLGADVGTTVGNIAGSIYNNWGE